MPGYRDIAAELRAALERGEFPPGARIPTEAELAERYGVARETVSRALRLLRSEGLLATSPFRGEGTYVPLPPVRLAVARYGAVTDPARQRADLGPWETACAEQGVAGRAEIVNVKTEPAPAAVADRLGIADGDQVVHRSRRMWAGDDIAQLQDAWMPVDLVAGTPLAGGDKVLGGVYAVMEAAGWGPDRVTEEVGARLATSSERDALRLGVGIPVLDLWRTTRDAAGRAVEVLHVIADSRYSTLVYDDLPIRAAEG